MELVKAVRVIENSVTEMSGSVGCVFRIFDRQKKSEKITEIVNHEGGIAMAASALFNITDDEREYARLTSELKYELDLQSDMVHAKRQGRLEANLENARRMKTLGFSTEQIQAVTGLSVQQIQDI
ncbi:MAG: hypothetical protein LBI04_03560 [Treponema sp.]|jgi:predicted transposase/invertase (TIGR01784 family)|nr:hypothetical protein [Treponema sp.]